jgi:two-component sensor histidine kinase
VLQWEEVGGPPAQSPSHKGFGTRLIERGLTRELAGEATLDYRPSGLLCTFRFPLPEAETVDYAEANARISSLREQKRA